MSIGTSMTRLIFAFLLWPLNVFADEVPPPLPALYQVVNIAKDDVLSIRQRPEAGSELVGTISYDATNVEIIAFSLQGGWAMVNDAGDAGWVSLRFLERLPDIVGFAGLPQSLQCFGVEPFWSLRFTQDGVAISRPEEELTYTINSVSPAPENVKVRETGVRLTWFVENSLVRAQIVPGRCTDGMSESVYGLHYFDNRGLGIGCCHL